jgi:hypothetical protein
MHENINTNLQAGDLVCEVDVENLTEDMKHATMLIESHEAGYMAK